jgi:hypothetical protein
MNDYDVLKRCLSSSALSSLWLKYNHNLVRDAEVYAFEF